jgi:hypothetical protein
MRSRAWNQDTQSVTHGFTPEYSQQTSRDEEFESRELMDHLVVAASAGSLKAGFDDHGFIG